MSKHIPLPLERRGTMIWTKDEVLNRPKYICMCSTVEQAEEIIEALNLHLPMQAALMTCLLALTDETGDVARREADACLTARELLPPHLQKTTTP